MSDDLRKEFEDAEMFKGFPGGDEQRNEIRRSADFPYHSWKGRTPPAAEEGRADSVIARVARQMLQVAHAFDPGWYAQYDFITDNFIIGHKERDQYFVVTCESVADNIYLEVAARGLVAAYRINEAPIAKPAPEHFITAPRAEGFV